MKRTGLFGNACASAAPLTATPVVTLMINAASTAPGFLIMSPSVKVFPSKIPALQCPKPETISPTPTNHTADGKAASATAGLDVCVEYFITAVSSATPQEKWRPCL